MIDVAVVGVDISCVGTDRLTGSGMSVAITEAHGEYGAELVSGANLTIDPSAIGTAWAPLWNCNVLLLQNEIPEFVNLVATREANSRGAKVLLNAAPARTVSSGLRLRTHGSGIVCGSAK